MRSATCIDLVAATVQIVSFLPGIRPFWKITEATMHEKQACDCVTSNRISDKKHCQQAINSSSPNVSPLSTPRYHHGTDFFLQGMVIFNLSMKISNKYLNSFVFFRNGKDILYYSHQGLCWLIRAFTGLWPIYKGASTKIKTMLCIQWGSRSKFGSSTELLNSVISTILLRAVSYNFVGSPGRTGSHFTTVQFPWFVYRPHAHKATEW